MPLIKNGTPAPVPEVKVDSAPSVISPKIEIKKAAPASETMSKAEWAAKDRKAARGYAFNAALQSPALMQYSPNLEAYLSLVRKVAEEGIKFVSEE